MKSISIFLKNIRNLLPYLILIAIYFFFINLEARKETGNKVNKNEKNIPSVDKSSFEEKNFRIKIPVIPYKK